MQVSRSGLRLTLASTAVSLILLAAGLPASASGATTPLAEVGSVGSAAGELFTPAGLAIDGSGDIWVAELNNNRISEFDPNGNFIRAFGGDVALPADPMGSALETCTDTTGCRDADQGSAAGQFTLPSGVAFDAAGNLYVANSGINRIDVFDVSAPTVTFVRGFGFDVLGPGDNMNFESCTVSCIGGEGGTSPGMLAEPRELALDGAGKLYVSERGGNRRITIIDVSGPSPAFLRAFGLDVAQPPGGSTLEDCDIATGCLQGDLGGAAGSLDTPDGIALDAANRLYVTETGFQGPSHRISVFDVSTATTGFVHAFGADVAGPPSAGNPFEVCPVDGACTAGDADGGAGALNAPSDVALDGAGSLYVTDRGNHRISVFNVAPANPTFNRAFGRDVLDPSDGPAFEVCAAGDMCVPGDTGTGAGELSNPDDVVVDCRGAIWVADTANNRLQRFGEPGTAGCPIPPATVTPTLAQNPTGQRAAALKKCKKKKTAKAKKKCKKKAKQLPV
jgi:DNA-binding beta-propeller fold protein YncE